MLMDSLYSLENQTTLTTRDSIIFLELYVINQADTQINK